MNIYSFIHFGHTNICTHIKREFVKQHYFHLNKKSNILGLLFQVVSALGTMPAKLCIAPAKLEPCLGSLHSGQI